MGGWYKLRGHDARNLGDIIDSLQSNATLRFGRMLMLCWNQMQANGEPCPHFTLGIRKIASECEASAGSAQRFIERMEREGWIVRVGELRKGRQLFVKRTFWWVAEEAGLDPFSRIGDPIRVNSNAQVDLIREKGVSAGRPDTHTESRALRDSGSAALSDESGRPQQTEDPPELGDGVAEYFEIRPLTAVRDPGGGRDGQGE